MPTMNRMVGPKDFEKVIRPERRGKKAFQKSKRHEITINGLLLTKLLAFVNLFHSPEFVALDTFPFSLDTKIFTQKKKSIFFAASSRQIPMTHDR